MFCFPSRKMLLCAQGFHPGNSKNWCFSCWWRLIQWSWRKRLHWCISSCRFVAENVPDLMKSFCKVMCVLRIIPTYLACIWRDCFSLSSCTRDPMCFQWQSSFTTHIWNKHSDLKRWGISRLQSHRNVYDSDKLFSLVKVWYYPM